MNVEPILFTGALFAIVMGVVGYIGWGIGRYRRKTPDCYLTEDPAERTHCWKCEHYAECDPYGGATERLRNLQHMASTHGRPAAAFFLAPGPGKTVLKPRGTSVGQWRGGTSVDQIPKDLAELDLAELEELVASIHRGTFLKQAEAAQDHAMKEHNRLIELGCTYSELSGHYDCPKGVLEKLRKEKSNEV